MHKHLLKALVSLVTLVGGHFLNRRFDRAVLFFPVFLLSIFGVYYASLLYIGGTELENYLQWYQQILAAMAYIGLGTLVISAIEVIRDRPRFLTSDLI